MKVLFQTFGCKVNQVETELLREQVLSGGFEIVPEAAQADLCVINSCSVTAEADRKCRQYIRRVQRENERIRVVLTGCYATRAPEEIRVEFPSIEIISNKEKNSLFGCLGLLEVEKLATTAIGNFSGHTRAFVKVQDGCRSTCTYCIIPDTRPDLWCKPSDEVVHEVEHLVATGYQEIVLTGIRLGRYLHTEASGDRTTLPELLKRLCAIPGHFRIRLSSFEITEVTDALVTIIQQEPKLCHHMHIPLQSGEDKTLKRMGRWYDAKFYRDRVEAIRHKIPDVAITADVIVGFPGETEADFLTTLNFIEHEAQLSGLHVFPFSTRPGTQAASLPDQHTPTEIQNRSRRLIAVNDRLRASFAQRFLGTTQEVLIEDESHGFTSHYIKVTLTTPTEKGLVRAQLKSWEDGVVVGEVESKKYIEIGMKL